MSRYPWRFAACAVVLLSRLSMAAELSMQLPQPAAVVQLQRSQWRVDTGRSYPHPFDPDQVAVDATFTGPGGEIAAVPAFWDESAFFVRFAPPAAGLWKAAVTLKDGSGSRTVAGESFSVAPSRSAGFIRRAVNNRYFQFDNGTSYFPVGLNLCWAKGPSVASWFDQTFTVLAANGGNYARLWMCHPDVKLERRSTGLNNYDPKSAQFYDDVLAAGEADGVALMLTFLNHREFIDHDMWGPAEWRELPYNAALGGPAERPIDFFTNAECRRLFKARLRYIVARYSAYRSVAFWEFFNEQENAQLPIPNAWNAEMATYLRQIDPVKHLITTSATVPDPVWREQEMDLTQTHIYGDGTPSDLVAAIAQAERNHEPFAKPHLIGEMGLDYKGNDGSFDPDGKGTAFHNALWAAMTTGNAGAAAYWWWDNYIEPKNLWHEFKPVAEVAKTIDWAHRDYRPVPIDTLFHTDTTGTSTDLTILPTGGWGDTNRQTIVVPPNGRPHLSAARFLYSDHHKELTAPLTFDLTLPEHCTLRLLMSQVSDLAVVRVSVDDKPVRDFLFDALPGSAGVAHTRYDGENKLYVADIADPVEVPVPAGHHRVTLAVVAGDWVTLSKVVFTGALDPKFANLAAFAVQDAARKDTLLWLWDTRSNWKDDQSNLPAPTDPAVKLMVPGITSGSFVCDWIDTRSGRTLFSETAAAHDGGLSLQAPPFTRDVALRVSAAVDH